MLVRVRILVSNEKRQGSRASVRDFLRKTRVAGISCNGAECKKMRGYLLA